MSESVAALEENNITIVCGTNLEGNPAPIVQWFSNIGDKVSADNPAFTLNDGPDIVSLTITETNSSHSGIWICVLTTKSPNGTTIQRLQRNLTVTILGE